MEQELQDLMNSRIGYVSRKNPPSYFLGFNLALEELSREDHPQNKGRLERLGGTPDGELDWAIVKKPKTMAAIMEMAGVRKEDIEEKSVLPRALAEYFGFTEPMPEAEPVDSEEYLLAKQTAKSKLAKVLEDD